ncbi:MAG: hypothetical protein GX471_09475 [Candidatus Microthrix parvicella]|uniref:Septum formation-related domain-containing protein n=1 Tax=Candidatus Neomicrothrix parvicella RN1 TaxID=1229780 RepID=R4Z3S0_9ACTN|nr:septum formation family protein [Candidatus Microthrix parvicella]NLH66388.1 hypothetical protein [Candidatus Microthrix parvicella]CCM63951.1 exported hypothetical protein [Candidatus Microthrix parvicella RN1]
MTHQPGSRRRRAAFASLVTVVAAAVVIVGCGGNDAPVPPTTAPTSTTEASRTDRDLSQPADNAVPDGVENLRVGDCYDPAPDPSQRNVMVLIVPCDQPHQYEVYEVAAFTEGTDADFPGDDAVRNYAEEYCFQGFEGFVGQVWRDSELDIETWFPTRVSWTKGADRKLSCVLYHRKKADLTGSMQGTGY